MEPSENSMPPCLPDSLSNNTQCQITDVKIWYENFDKMYKMWLNYSIIMTICRIELITVLTTDTELTL